MLENRATILSTAWPYLTETKFWRKILSCSRDWRHHSARHDRPRKVSTTGLPIPATSVCTTQHVIQLALTGRNHPTSYCEWEWDDSLLLSAVCTIWYKIGPPFCPPLDALPAIASLPLFTLYSLITHLRVWSAVGDGLVLEYVLGTKVRTEQ